MVKKKALTIRYKIYLDKLANYNNYDKQFESNEIKKVFIFKGIIILFLILSFFINIVYFIKYYLKKENFLGDKDLSIGDKIVITFIVLFLDFLVLIFCIFSSWYKKLCIRKLYRAIIHFSSYI